MTTPKNIEFSIIVNCHNSELFIKEAIVSLLNQTFKNFEIIIINNFSNDNTQNIISVFKDKRIKVYSTNKFLTLGAARNFGLSKVCGNYISFLDSDDFWDQKKLEFSLIKLKEGYGIVYSDVIYFDNNQKFKLYSRNRPYQGECFEKLLFDYNLCLSSLIFKRSIILENNIDFDQNLNVCEDLDFFLRIAKKTKIGYVNKVLVNYRIHKNSLTAQKRELFFLETEYIINKLVSTHVLKNKLLTKNKIENAIYLWKKKKNITSFKILFNTPNFYLSKKFILFFVFLFPFSIIKFVFSKRFATV